MTTTHCGFSVLVLVVKQSAGHGQTLARRMQRLPRNTNNFVDIRSRGDQRWRKSNDVVNAERTNNQATRKRCLRDSVADLESRHKRRAFGLVGHQLKRG